MLIAPPPTKRSLAARLKAATAPTPTYNLTDPTTWASVTGLVCWVVFGLLGVTDPSGQVRQGISFGIPVLLLVIALVKHRIGLQTFLADLASSVRSWPSNGTASMTLTYHQLPTLGTPSGGSGQPPVPALIHDPATHKLGKAPVKHDPRTLLLTKYVRALPAPPPSADWTAKVAAWPMMANDSVGDCTCAAAGHLVELWTAYAGSPVILDDATVLAAYSAITGYNPADPSTDQGAAELDVLNYWRQSGIGGHSITAYCYVNLGDDNLVRQAVNLFGGVYIGLALPTSAQSQDVWDVPTSGTGQGTPGAPGSWGGHAVPIVGYDESGLTCVTWGALKRMTWAFLHTYCDEAYAIVSADFLNSAGVDPQGLNLAGLLADLEQIN